MSAIESGNRLQVLTFSPPISELFRCVNISFGDDELVEDKEQLVVIFEPDNNNDRFPSGNRINFTIIDDESKGIPYVTQS